MTRLLVRLGRALVVYGLARAGVDPDRLAEPPR